MKTGNTVLSSFGTTIFEVMSRLAQENDAINLGQGFPDGNGPDDVVEAGVDYLRNGLNQYPSMYGIPDLRQPNRAATIKIAPKIRAGILRPSSGIK